jgi:hypothetical protein
VIHSQVYNTSLPSVTTHPAEDGLWSNRTGTLRKVVATGDSAPGTGGQFNFFSEFLYSFAAFNNRGDIAFSASTNTNLSAAGVWISRGALTGPVGQLDFIAGAGSGTNGVLPGVSFSNAQLGGFNDAKQVALLAQLQGAGVTDQNNSSLWRWTNGSLVLLAREGQAIPGTGLTFQSGFNTTNFGSTSLNSAGTAVFSARVTDSSGPHIGIFTAGDNGISLKALGGQQAPGMPTGVVFDDSIGSTGNLAINGFGQVAFLGRVTGPGISSINDQGLWATDRAGVLRLIVREQGSIEYLPGQFGTVGSFFASLRSGNQEGDIRSFNDQGQIAFYAAGTNFGWGIFVSDVATAVPEPSSALMAVTTILVLVKVRRRAIFIGV